MCCYNRKKEEWSEHEFFVANLKAVFVDGDKGKDEESIVQTDKHSFGHIIVIYLWEVNG